MLGASKIEEALGESRLSIVSRIFGLLLQSIAITAIIESLLQYCPGWCRHVTAPAPSGWPGRSALAVNDKLPRSRMAGDC